MTTPGIPCGCAANTWEKGTIVCISDQERGSGLLVYMGRSEHCKPWNHIIKLVDMETLNSYIVHSPCRDVYAPFPDPWPWFVAPETMGEYQLAIEEGKKREAAAKDQLGAAGER